MADEITIDARMRVANGFLNLDLKSTGAQWDMTGDNMSSQVQTIGTSHETIEFGDISTAGWAFFRNVDATNYVEIGRDVSSTFYPVIKLEPGEACVCRLASTAIYAQANTASVPLHYAIVED